jgi:probable rRNA maturation factor
VIEIAIANEQTTHPVDEATLTSAARVILEEEGIRSAAVSIAVVDDPTIHELNRRYLQHDYATDTLSFLLERDGDHLEGEVIVSADTAAESAARYGWNTGDELLLYVIHATLHLVGYDDGTDEDRTRMRQQERRYLARYGLQPRYDCDATAEDSVAENSAAKGNLA